MAHLHADEDFDYPVVEELRRLGHDGSTVQEAGQGNRRTPDDAVLAFAVTQGRAVLTFNRRHFRRLHPASQTHAGVIVCTWDQDAATLAARIHAAVESHSTLEGQLIRITRPPRP
jgi:hypothetical protein